MARRSPRDLPAFLDTPAGLVTPGGVRFRTTEKLLREFAGPVFQREPLDRLVRQAEVWLRSGATLALWMLPLLLLVFPSWLAALAVLLFYVAWETAAPSFPGAASTRVLSVLEQPIVQAVLYVVVLSLLGMGGAIPAVVVGLVGFIAFRLGAVEYVLRPLLGPLRARFYPLPIPDQVLRALIVRAALRHRVALPELEKLEASAQAAWRGRRR